MAALHEGKLWNESPKFTLCLTSTLSHFTLLFRWLTFSPLSLSPHSHNSRRQQLVSACHHPLLLYKCYSFTPLRPYLTFRVCTDMTDVLGCMSLALGLSLTFPQSVHLSLSLSQHLYLFLTFYHIYKKGTFSLHLWQDIFIISQAPILTFLPSTDKSNLSSLVNKLSLTPILLPPSHTSQGPHSPLSLILLPLLPCLFASAALFAPSFSRS